MRFENVSLPPWRSPFEGAIGAAGWIYLGNLRVVSLAMAVVIAVVG
jgi:hypothetical protein